MRYRPFVICLAWSAVLLGGGCNAMRMNRSSSVKARKVRLASDIIGVRRYFANNPFLSFDDESDPNPEGFKVTYYAVSNATSAGRTCSFFIRGSSLMRSGMMSVWSRCSTEMR